MKGTTWKIILFAAIIIILYIPLVFMGANIFFPKYDYTNYPMYNECYMSKPMPVNGYDNTTQEQINKCQQEQNKIQQDYEKQKEEIGNNLLTQKRNETFSEFLTQLRLKANLLDHISTNRP